MKKYLAGYALDEDAPSEVDEPANYVTNYADTPEHWTMATRREVERELAILQRFQVPVHIGPHVCTFEIEEVGATGFAIVCTSHP
jgi:hypothetical protein